MEVLGRFAREQSITYDLLSDEGSAVIRRLGLVNEHLDAQQAFYGRPGNQRGPGLPYPATIVLDEAGTVVERHFEQSYRPRIGAGAALRLATGDPPQAARAATARAAGEEPVTVTASVGSADFRPLEMHEVHVELGLAEGWHVYTEPVPDGYTALRVDVSADSEIEVRPAELLPGVPGGTVRVTVPFRLPGAGFDLDVAYQACSDAECLPPTTVRLSLALDETPTVQP